MEMESRPKVSALVDPSSLCVVVLYGFARVVCRRPRVFFYKYFDGQSHSKFRFQPSPSAILYAKKEKKSKRNSSKIQNEPLRNLIVGLELVFLDGGDATHDIPSWRKSIRDRHCARPPSPLRLLHKHK